MQRVKKFRNLNNQFHNYQKVLLMKVYLFVKKILKQKLNKNFLRSNIINLLNI